MLLDRLTRVSRIEIWSPKWSTRTVKIACHKVGVHNIITFPKSKAMAGEWYVSGNTVRSYPVTQMLTKTKNLLNIYEINISDLKPVEWKIEEYRVFDDRTGEYVIVRQ